MAEIRVGNHTVTLEDAGDMVVAALHRDGEFEPAVLAAWGQVCSAGGRVVDVGAYTGLYAIAAAKHGCAVVAFEPNPNVQRRLIYNVQQNRVNLKVIGQALSDREDCVALHMKRSPAMTSAASIADSTGRDYQTQVMTTRFDTAFPDRVIRAMKIDVEGHELAVLKGAVETLRQNPVTILIELLSEGAINDADAFLSEIGYRGERLDDRNFMFTKNLAGG